MTKIAIIGGGAGGFFTAINTAEKHSDYDITIFEKGKNVLGKVKVSGGGRCNVTHACFEPKELVKFYPRGTKELLGPFHSFMTGDTMEWFEKRGVALKIEEDNRVFPVSDDSQSIIDCLQEEIRRLGIKVKTQSTVTDITPLEKGWSISVNGTEEKFDKVVIATGGNSQSVWSELEKLGYKIIEPIPSLFTFNTKDTRFRNLSGLVVKDASVKISGTKFLEQGPVLITHWGLSGPGILKLSSVGARHLHEKNYQFQIQVDWAFSFDKETVEGTFKSQRSSNPKKTIHNSPLFDIPKRFWHSLLQFCQISDQKIWAELGKKEKNKLTEAIKNSTISIHGKSTNKEEFVTCGGVDLKQINFTKFESKLHPNLFFVGEVLDIDALTGGFNFQAAWTGGWVVAQNI
ncbi:BaiN/RdsA family NAD(P)/FAD-dependent oxidoreductase [Parvicella tangerina]|uniref:3-dehydro-bile acid delta(4,6)-reductase n=1 Tax=Parvicella tangerina TaxID=2829795 RepID=A0A916JQQ5_9FLAO|nr:NAD(P)/FAD-dependent oxidoreductase [Parvicella tangerina]CAG5086634.1 3-dehydro-bile acid delta(4,6)-reductase [Parvicella tangerina]